MTLRYKKKIFAVKLSEENGIKVDRAEIVPLSIHVYEEQSKSSWTIFIACKLFDAIR